MKYVYVVTTVDSDRFFADVPEIEVFRSKGMAEFYAKQQVKMLERNGYSEECFSEENDEWWSMEHDGSKVQIFIDQKEVKGE